MHSPRGGVVAMYLNELHHEDKKNSQNEMETTL